MLKQRRRNIGGRDQSIAGRPLATPWIINNKRNPGGDIAEQALATNSVLAGDQAMVTRKYNNGIAGQAFGFETLDESPDCPVNARYSLKITKRVFLIRLFVIEIAVPLACAYRARLPAAA